MDVTALLDDSLSRIPGAVRRHVEGLDQEALTWRPAPDANPIGWLVWHLTRVQDAQITPLCDADEVWTADGWSERFSLPDAPAAHGYGWNTEQVGALGLPDVDTLLDHLDAVSSRCRELVGNLSPADLDRVVDDSYDPPVTAGVRIVSIIADAIQHAGQIGYVRGLWDASR